MSFDVDVRSAFPRIIAAVDDAAYELLDQVLDDIADNARDAMTSPKHGRSYPPPGFIASAPGEAPAVRPFPFYPTGGELYAGIHKRRTGNEGMVWSSTDYAAYLEYGTSKMEPRPFIGPAVEEVLKDKRQYQVTFKVDIEGEGL